MRKCEKGGRPSTRASMLSGGGQRTFGAPVFTILTNRAGDGDELHHSTRVWKREGGMPSREEESSRASTAKTVMGFLAAVSIFVLMFLAFHNNAATVELTQRQTAMAEKLKELGEG